MVGLPGGDAKPVEFADTVPLDLAALSAAKFREMARIMGTQFYSPTMNGCDWPALTEKWAGLAANARTDEEIEAYLRRAAITAHHPAGTCKMGTDSQAVLDPQLRVRGVENLRVVDASAMPDMVGAHINACVIMMADKASDMIAGR